METGPIVLIKSCERMGQESKDSSPLSVRCFSRAGEVAALVARLERREAGLTAEVLKLPANARRSAAANVELAAVATGTGVAE